VQYANKYNDSSSDVEVGGDHGVLDNTAFGDLLMGKTRLGECGLLRNPRNSLKYTCMDNKYLRGASVTDAASFCGG
jgi:hypothetical protein